MIISWCSGKKVLNQIIFSLSANDNNCICGTKNCSSLGTDELSLRFTAGSTPSHKWAIVAAGLIYSARAMDDNPCMWLSVSFGGLKG
jgi:hypothetical protein